MSKASPWTPKVCKTVYSIFGCFLVVLGYYFTYCWGPDSGTLIRPGMLNSSVAFGEMLINSPHELRHADSGRRAGGRYVWEEAGLFVLPASGMLTNHALAYKEARPSHARNQ